MLNEKRIRLMTELAHYESKEGKEDLQISRYYQSDYIGIGLFKNLFLTTVGYLLLWVLILAYNMDYLLDNLHKMNIAVVIFEFVMGYIVMVVIYSAITYVIRYRRYKTAQKNVKQYCARLNKLAKEYR